MVAHRIADLQPEHVHLAAHAGAAPEPGAEAALGRGGRRSAEEGEDGTRRSRAPVTTQTISLNPPDRGEPFLPVVSRPSNQPCLACTTN